MKKSIIEIKGWKREGLIYTCGEEQLTLGKFRAPTQTQVVSRIGEVLAGSELSYFQDEISMDGLGELVGSYMTANVNSLREFMPDWIGESSHSYLFMEYLKPQGALGILMQENGELYTPGITGFLSDYLKIPALTSVQNLGHKMPLGWESVLRALRESNFSAVHYNALPDANPKALDLVCLLTFVKGIPLLLDRLEIPLAHQEKILGAKPRSEGN